MDFSSFAQRSRVSDYDDKSLNRNLILDYDSLTYVRFMKRFAPPQLGTLELKNDPSGRVREKIGAPFHLRFYMPKNWITRSNRRSNRVVIMFNGMNEVEKFDLYDILGEYFANHGLCAILLPTPLHLNRRLSNINTGPMRPTDLAITDPLLFYYLFLQSHKELQHLLHLLQGSTPACKQADDLDMAFYKNYFWAPSYTTNQATGRPDGQPTTEVVIFGYSLGGLRALTCFLEKPHDYRCCVTMNAPADLRLAHASELKIPVDQWDNIMDGILQELDTDPPNRKPYEDVDGLRQLFLGVYFGLERQPVKNRMRPNMDRYLAITSGADRIVDVDSAKHLVKHGKHIHQLIVAGVDHNPATDPNWYDVLPRVEDGIMDFINTCDERHRHKEEVIAKIRELLEPLETFGEILSKATVGAGGEPFWTKEMEAVVTGLKGHYGSDTPKVDEFLYYYYLSKAYYPNFTEVLEKILRDRTREQGRI